MRTETDKAVEILERGNRQMNLEMCALVEDLRRERDEARAELADLKAEITRRDDIESARAQASFAALNLNGRVA